MHGDTNLVLPEPVIDLDGELVTSVSVDGKPEILCTLMSWVEGKIPPTVDAMSDEQLARAGSLMAQLHKHSQQFKLPASFKRPIYDEKHFSDRLDVLYRALSNTELDPNELKLWKSNAKDMIDCFSRLERKQDCFGLIHADFHSGNYLLCDGEVHIIDFDLCGFGFYLYDLALALMELNEQQQKAFLEGYEIVKPLPVDYINLKQVFLSLAYLDNLGFLVANPKELTFVVEEFRFVLEAFRNAIALIS